MRAFKTVEGGYASRVADWERELLARLVLETEALLEAEDGAGGSGQETSPGVGVRSQESNRDRELLAALERELGGHGAPGGGAEPGTCGPGTAEPGHAGVSPEVVELLEVLLPEASEDPLTAVEVRALTRERLRQDKAGRLARVARELRAPSRQGEVVVPLGQEADWLGAMNDIRLVLSRRLGIASAQDAEAVRAAACEEPPREETFHQRWYRGTALVYDMLTWWQESLVSVLLEGTVPE
ncbi:DUF2017 family protein [Actinomyces wuliandei]|uniref:DUF2017 family protein n=1 Tax=Actinomyces wuliandei TaxID=2057743 RepID=UPI000FDC5EF9|nr:DUF2017 family protein [Actinomyces wuliandei]